MNQTGTEAGVITTLASHPNLQALFHRFRAVVTSDFEFHGSPELPFVVCMVAHVHYADGTVRVVRMWRDELLRHTQAPFDVGSDAVFVAYNASAEYSCFLALGWQLPTNTIDLYAEHRLVRIRRWST
jgi:DNA polymerase-1